MASGLNCVRSGDAIFERDSQLDEKNFSQGKRVNDNVWTLCGRRDLNRKSGISAIYIKRKLLVAGTAQSVRWKVVVVVGAVEPAVGEGLRGQGG